MVSKLGAEEDHADQIRDAALILLTNTKCWQGLATPKNLGCPFFFSELQRKSSIIQGISKRGTPGCVKEGERVVFCLPTAGRRAQLFHLIFSQPGAHL